MESYNGGRILFSDEERYMGFSPTTSIKESCWMQIGL